MNGKNLKWFGIILIIITGTVHFIEALEYFEADLKNKSSYRLAQGRKHH